MTKPDLLTSLCLAGLFVLQLAGCNPAPTPAPTLAPTQAPTRLPTALLTALPSATLQATQTPPATPTLSPSLTPTPALTGLCSPLEGESLSDLARPDLLKNPFQAPRPGYDDGHHGVDFAYWTRADGTAMLGLPVLSALDGRAAAAIHDRQPYGNAVIIETPLEKLPPAWLSRLPFAAYDPSAPLQPAVGLSCPAYDYQPQPASLSLYLLYAHFNQPSTLSVGSPVQCGQQIGQVGTTGRSVNPHLHIETRIGPSGMSFASMAHYENDATVDEMRSYCLWRISGAFKAFDPMQLLSIP